MPPQVDAERWMRFAEEDLQVAGLVLERGIYTQTCFHAQQAVEKTLKGLPKVNRRDFGQEPFYSTREQLN